jgi:CheY-like chemotaxis protein
MKPLERILYVDDEEILHKVTRLTLERMGGYTVEVAASGAQALESAPIFRPDLILLDVMMPGMDGPATLAKLRGMAEFDGVPVVFITAKAQPHEIERFRALGAADVLTKPFDPKQLCADIKAIWTRIASD